MRAAAAGDGSLAPTAFLPAREFRLETRRPGGFGVLRGCPRVRAQAGIATPVTAVAAAGAGGPGGTGAGWGGVCGGRLRGGVGGQQGI